MSIRTALAAALAIALAAPAHGALRVGDPAPDFWAQGALGGKSFLFHLDNALKRGPVVLYFFPAAFTPGCTIEAHNFAMAAAKFKALGGRLIGITSGNMDRIAEFSKVECHSKFPVARDPRAIIAKRYDAILATLPDHSDRTSYVIARDGKIAAVWSDLSPTDHVDKMLEGVRSLHAGHG